MSDTALSGTAKKDIHFLPLLGVAEATFSMVALTRVLEDMGACSSVVMTRRAGCIKPVVIVFVVLLMPCKSCADIRLQTISGKRRSSRAALVRVIRPR